MVGEDGQRTNEADSATEGGVGACSNSRARVGGTERACTIGFTKKQIGNQQWREA
jgi:hypothetical protein